MRVSRWVAAWMTVGSVSLPLYGWAQTTDRVSVSVTGGDGNAASSGARITASGRYVVFASSADNLVENDHNGASDVFVRDLELGRTERANVSTAGVEANAGAFEPSISADGRFVAFASGASNLVAGGPASPNFASVFIRDRRLGTTEVLRVRANGDPADRGIRNPSISDDGRYVAFMSDARNLAAECSSGLLQIFVHDRQSARTECVSVSDSGVAGNDDSVDPSISGDGQIVGSWSSYRARRTWTPAASREIRSMSTGAIS